MSSKSAEIVEESYSTKNPSINGRYMRFNISALSQYGIKRVYKAFDTIDAIDVAWNEIDLSDIIIQDEKTKILKEIEMLSRLNHPNILKISNYWFDDKQDKVCFITHIIYNGSISRYFRKRQINLVRVKQICKQILAALIYLHENGIIHRDIKLDNIFIAGNTGRVILGDLNLSCQVSDDHRSIVGSTHWMAPEAYQEQYDEMVDIWSFGMCVLELITSSIPYSECKGAFQVYQHIMAQKKPEALKKINDLYVHTFINICLNFDPRIRPSAKELLYHPFLLEKPSDTKLCSQIISPQHIIPNIIPPRPPRPPQPRPPRPPRPREEAKVHIKENQTCFRDNGDKLKIALRLTGSTLTKPMNVVFDFEHTKERPYSVALEMTNELQLESTFTSKVAFAIKEALTMAMEQDMKSDKNIVQDLVYTDDVITKEVKIEPVRRIPLSDALIALQSLTSKSSEVEIFRITLKLSMDELVQQFAERHIAFNTLEGKYGLARRLVDILKRELKEMEDEGVERKQEISTVVSLDIEEIKFCEVSDNIKLNDVELNKICEKKIQIRNEYKLYIQQRCELIQIRFAIITEEYKDNHSMQKILKESEEKREKEKINKKRAELIEKFEEWLSDIQQIARLRIKIIQKTLLQNNY